MWDKANLVIELKKVNLCQGKQLILSGVDFSLSTNETVYLFGPNGSGKSSLLKFLYGSLACTGGLGRVFDYELHKPDNEQLTFLRRRLGIMCSDFPLIDDINLEDNLSLILQATDWLDNELRKERISEVLNTVNLSGKALCYPRELSRSECRKAMFARAILNHPGLLLLDEPVAELDSESGEDLLRIIFQYVRVHKIAMLFSTNNKDIPADFPANQLSLEKGKTCYLTTKN
jgi:cell division transport system ATP-binding protein